MRTVRSWRSWARLGAAAAVCLLLAGCGKISKKNFDKISNGMSRSEVEGILGPGTEVAAADAKGLAPDFENVKPPMSFGPGGKMFGPGGKGPFGPGGKFPEGKGPEGKAPEGKAPELKFPDFKAPEGKAPDFKMPDFKGPGGKGNFPSPPGIPTAADFKALAEGTGSAKWVKWGTDKKFILVGFLNDKVLWKTSKGL
jgi:hypothetical protein